MQFPMQQEHTMTPDTSLPWSGDRSDLMVLLRGLVAADDWASFCEKLQRELPRWLPSTRVDIFASISDGTVELRFSSDSVPSAHGEQLVAESGLRAWFEQQGYKIAVMLPLVAAGHHCGWLVLAQERQMILPLLRTVADQLAPLVAMRLQYELLQGDLINSTARAANLEQRIHTTQVLRLRALLATGTAHDIGNIFTTVIGHAQLLQQDVAPDLQRDIGMIIRAAEDGRYLLRRLQSATPRSADSVQDTTFLPTVIDEAVQLTRPLWESPKQITVHVNLHDTPLVSSLAADIREVLINLILNAVAAMPTGGEITIECALKGDRAALSVTDTGYGIAPEYQEAIFQPLTTTRQQGSGLGLSVSRAIVEGYGGTLTVRSAPGQGATFIVTLPAVQRDRAVSEA